jgi:hypothetical protein
MQPLNFDRLDKNKNRAIITLETVYELESRDYVDDRLPHIRVVKMDTRPIAVYMTEKVYN